jgi:hypothetical protein
VIKPRYKITIISGTDVFNHYSIHQNKTSLSNSTKVNMLVKFHHCDKIPVIDNLKEKIFYFWPIVHYFGFQSMISLLYTSGPMVR